MQAWKFDSAVSAFGSTLQAELEGVKGKTDKARQANQMRVLDKWIPEAKARRKTKFADPANR